VIYQLLLKGWKNTSKEYNMLFGGMATNSCLIYLLFLIDIISIKLYRNGDIQSNVFIFLIILSLGCWLSCFLFDRYILCCFWQKRRKDYDILDILGISLNKLKRIIIFENVILTVIPSMIGILLGIVIVNFLGIIKQLAERVSFQIFDLRWCLLSFIFIMIVDLLSAISCFRFKENISKRESKYSYFKMILGLCLIVLAEILILLFQCRIELILIEIVLIICGAATIFLNINEQSLELIKKWKGLYYKKVFQINTFFENYKNNALILFAAFLCNFFILYIVGSIGVSYIQVEAVEIDYPYDMIYYGANKAKISESTVQNYHEIQYLHISNEFITGIIISEKSFEELTGESIQLQPYECLRIFQKQEEKNDSDNIIIGKEISYGNGINLLLKEERNVIIFGKVREHGLGTILVVSSDTYDNFRNELMQEYLQIYNESSREKSQIIIDNGDYIDTQHIIEMQQMINTITITVFILLGIIILTEIYWIIGIKMNDKESEMISRLQVLSILGINDKQVIRKVKGYSSQILFVPYITSAFFSLQLFLKDYFYQGGDERLPGIFSLFVIAIGIFQYIVYFMIVRRQICKFRAIKE